MRIEKKQKLRQLRRWRIRKKVQGTAERPRMAVCFTGKNIYVQFVDDLAGKTLAATSTRVKKGADRGGLKANVNGAKKIGASDCNACHTILAQGNAEQVEKLNSKGQPFFHIDAVNEDFSCNNCHTGAFPKE